MVVYMSVTLVDDDESRALLQSQPGQIAGRGHLQRRACHQHHVALSRRLLGLIDTEGLRSEQILPRIEELAGWLADVRTQLQKPSNDEAEIRRLKTRAATALAEGDFELAAETMRLLRLMSETLFLQSTQLISKRWMRNVKGLTKKWMWPS